MKRIPSLLMALVAAAALVTLLPDTPLATDKDGPDDCLRTLIIDFGDAPEGIPAYPSTAPLVIGAFPTCLTPGPVGTQNIDPLCPPISTPPGATGFVKHVQFGLDNYWLGCYPTPLGPMGIDTEMDGKVNTPSIGFSACMAGLPTDCVEAIEGGFDQDECYGDGSDAGLKTKVAFVGCHPNWFSFQVYSCAHTTREIYLNILVDWNRDGDWNDSFFCPQLNGGCVYEWSVKNSIVSILPGCNTLPTPAIYGGPFVHDNI